MEEDEDELLNHFVPLNIRKINNKLSLDKRIEIKKNIGIINDKSKEKVKSILTGKIRGQELVNQNGIQYI